MTGIFITGATGGLGAHVVQAAVKQTRSVVVLTRPGTDPIAASRVPAQVERRDDWHTALHEAGRGAAVVHLAGYAHHDSRTPGYEEANWSANHQLPLSLMRTAVSAGVAHFVLVSTIAVHGRRASRVGPDTATAPSNAYGQSKLAAERDLTRLAAGTSTRLSILRIPMVYGPAVKGNLRLMMGAAKRRWRLPLGRAVEKRSLLYVENFADYSLHVVDRPPVAGATAIHYLADDFEPSPRDLYARIFAQMGGSGPATFAVPRGVFRGIARCDRWLTTSRVGRLPVISKLAGRAAEVVPRLFEPLVVERTGLSGWRQPVDFHTALERTVRSYIAEQ